MKITEGRAWLASSDVANFLACRRLTQLDLLRARGELRARREFDIGFHELVRRGEVHERSVLDEVGLGIDRAQIRAGAERTMVRYQQPAAMFSAAITRKKAAHP